MSQPFTNIKNNYTILDYDEIEPIVNASHYQSVPLIWKLTFTMVSFTFKNPNQRKLFWFVDDYPRSTSSENIKHLMNITKESYMCEIPDDLELSNIDRNGKILYPSRLAIFKDYEDGGPEITENKSNVAGEVIIKYKHNDDKYPDGSTKRIEDVAISLVKPHLSVKDAYILSGHAPASIRL